MEATSEFKFSKRAVVGLVAVILILTALEFPAPIGFETRPQGNVSLIWLIFFLVILVTEIAAAALVFKKPGIGGKLGIIAAVLNVLQVIADQTHLMQPEIAPFGYLILEDSVAVASIALAYFSWKVISINSTT